MTQQDKEFLQSLHPLLPEALCVRQSGRHTLDKIPCCFLLRDNENDRQVLKLNDSGVLIWQLCHEEREVGEIVDLLSEAFEQEREDMARDVSRVVDYLLEEHALVEAAPVNSREPAGTE